jgi:hypothetical protein
MGISETRSPNNTTGNEPMRGYSPGSRSSPSRADGSHRAGHLGKSASQPVSARRDSTPVVGGNRTPFSEYDRR